MIRGASAPFFRRTARKQTARRCSPVHRHMRASLASPPRLPQPVIDASTGRRRPGLGRASARGHRQSLAGLADLRPHRLRAVCRAPDPGAALLANASAHVCLAGVAAAPATARDRRLDGPSSARAGASVCARAPAVPCWPCGPSSASASRGLPCARSRRGAARQRIGTCVPRWLRRRALSHDDT